MLACSIDVSNTVGMVTVAFIVLVMDVCVCVLLGAVGVVAFAFVVVVVVVVVVAMIVHDVVDVMVGDVVVAVCPSSVAVMPLAALCV